MTDSPSSGSRLRSVLVSIGKLCLVAALMAWVAWNVQWTDTLVVGEGEAAQSLSGTILGDWKADVVRFVPNEGERAGVELGVARKGEDGEVFPGFLTYWQGLDAGLFTIGALLYGLVACFAALRWWWLLRINDLRVSPLEALRLTWIGIFFNNVVPGQTGGDLVKALYIVRRCPDQRAEAFVTVIVDRVLGLASLALLAAIVVLFVITDYWQIALMIWALLIGVCIGAVVAFSRRVRRAVLLDKLLLRLPGKIGGTLQKVDAAVFHYRGHASGVFFWLLLGMVNHAVNVASWVLVGYALGVELPALQYFVLIPVINIVSAVPIAPNGWGIGEFITQRLFGDWGKANLGANGYTMMATQGAALSVLYRIHLTLWSLVGGVLLLFDRQRVTRDELDAELARERAEVDPAPS